jgi:hypothetical protein
MIIGSSAIRYWFPEFNREPKDVDIIKDMYTFDYKSEKRVEWLENSFLKNYYTKPITIIPPDDLLSLKISHLFWDLPNNSWEKHIYDVNFLLEKGCKLNHSLFWKLYYYWETVHGKRKTSDLNMSAKEFFNNVISYDMKHDDVHELLVTHPYFKNNPPTYKKILKDGSEVDVCMDKFNYLSEIEKFNVVFEEVAVMSLENRFPKELHWKAKYQRMLKKFILNHCKIEEGLWIIQNHKNLLTNIPFNYEDYINKAKLLNNNII